MKKLSVPKGKKTTAVQKRIKTQVGAQENTAANIIFGKMVELISTGEWRSGMHLSEVQLSERFEVSRTPVREALGLLKEAGMATRQPKLGYFVSPFDIIACCELLNIRAVLEGYASSELTSRRSDIDIIILRDIVKDIAAAAKDSNQNNYIQAENAFHDYILEHCGNRQLWHLLYSSSMGTLIRGIRERIVVLAEMTHVQTAAEKEHLEIVDAIAEGDPSKAERCMLEHIRGGLERLQKTIGPIAWQKGNAFPNPVK